MTPGTAIAYGVVVMSVAVSAVAVIGLVRMRSALDRLHYLSVISTVCPLLVAVAVLVHDSLHQTAFKALSVAAITIVTGPVIIHATARCVAETGQEGA
jgi:monovalent cation/proton antiporter MnhG/PhaG subunit